MLGEWCIAQCQLFFLPSLWWWYRKKMNDSQCFGDFRISSLYLFSHFFTLLSKKNKTSKSYFHCFSILCIFNTHICSSLPLMCKFHRPACSSCFPAFLLMTWFPGGIPPNFLIRISEWGKKRQIIQPDIKDRSPIHILHQNLLMDLLDFFAVNKEVSSAETSHKKCHKL